VRADRDRLAQRSQDPLGQDERIALVFDQDGELVPTQPGDRVARSGRAPQPFGHPDEQAVARRVAEAVIHGLEVVQVGQDHRHRPSVTAVELGGVLDPIGEQRPVGELGERVVERLVAELLGLGVHLLLLRQDRPDERAVVQQGEELAADHAEHQDRGHEERGVVRDAIADLLPHTDADPHSGQHVGSGQGGH
jgi:hypothetical protein